MALRWLLLLPILLGGFLIAGVLGSLSTAVVGVWHLPGAGFSAALAVVILAYVAAPAVKLQTALCALLLGGGVAWWLLEPSFYPESYRDRGPICRRICLCWRPALADCLDCLPCLSITSGAVSRIERQADQGHSMRPHVDQGEVDMPTYGESGHVACFALNYNASDTASPTLRR